MARLDVGDDDLAGPRWSPDGTRLLVVIRVDDEAHLLEVAADGSGSRSLLAIPTGSLACPILSSDWSPNGHKVVVVIQHEDMTSGEVLLVDAATRQVRHLGTEQHYSYRKPVARWRPDGRIVLRSNRSGWSKLWLTDPADGEVTPLTRGDWDDAGFQIGSHGEVAFSSRAEQEGTGDDLWLLEVGASEPRRITHHPGVNVPLGWDLEGGVIYWHASSTEWGDLWRAPLDGGPSCNLTASMPIELSAKVAPPREVRIVGPAGTLSALVYLPVYHRAVDRHPGIVWIHGGPAAMSRNDWVPRLQWLANEGFVVITANFRGSVGHGVPHMQAVSGPGVGLHDLEDVLAAASYLRSLPEVDSSRGIGIGGWSWGGYLTFMAITAHPDVFACATARCGITDWHIQQAETEERAFDRRLLGGWLYEQPDLATERSPVTHLADIRTPLLVTHGEQDMNVPFRQVERFVELTTTAGKPVEATFYAHEGHINRIRDNQRDELERISRFYRKWLQPWNFVDNPTSQQR